ncbi:MAG: YraN family protein [Brevibacillus sp.]|nr:YraN family protein [Brevibacillus sp.]
MSKSRLALGRYGEELAAGRLVELGYRILARNVRFRTAELDIVASEGDTLVFVEVRTRRGSSRGTPAESIGWHKRKKLREAALYYLHMAQERGHRQPSGRYSRQQPAKRQEQRVQGQKSRDRRYSRYRFDVICVTVGSDGTPPAIQHIINAF